jgi:hypothetical protein
MSRRVTTTSRSTRHDATQALLKSGAQPATGRHRAPAQTPASTVPSPAAPHPRRARKVTPGL